MLPTTDPDVNAAAMEAASKPGAVVVVYVKPTLLPTDQPELTGVQILDMAGAVTFEVGVCEPGTEKPAVPAAELVATAKEAAGALDKFERFKKAAIEALKPKGIRQYKIFYQRGRSDKFNALRPLLNKGLYDRPEINKAIAYIRDNPEVDGMMLLLGDERYNITAFTQEAEAPNSFKFKAPASESPAVDYAGMSNAELSA